MIRLILCLVIFWNVENYFDPFDDPLTNDNDFTIKGEYAWTWPRFYKKRNEIVKTLIACGQKDDGSWEAPCIIGLCEIENFLSFTSSSMTPRFHVLVTGSFTGIHLIPGALMWRCSTGKNDSGRQELHFTRFPTQTAVFSGQGKSFMSGEFWIKGTPFIFCKSLAFLPGGARAETNRQAASTLLQRVVDSIGNVSAGARIVVMGDFNDPPEAPALRSLASGRLVNVSVPDTYKYNGAWECMDQFLVSESSFRELEYVKVARLPHLLERDQAHLGHKPKRTYQGPVYKGGISDHLPVTLKFITFVSYGISTSEDTPDGPVFCH